MARIDAYNHVIPKSYFDKFAEIAPDQGIVKFFGALTALHDEDAHMRLLDGFDDYRQIISLANPPIELLGSPEQTPALARIPMTVSPRGLSKTPTGWQALSPRCR